MTRVFIISDYADPTPKGRSEKVETRVRVFKESGIEPIVMVPDDETVTGERPEHVQSVKYPGYKYFSIFSRSLIPRIVGRLGFPDPYFRWILSAVRAVGKYHPSNDDVILTMGSPVSSHIIGLICKRRFNLKWIADFRDPWVLNKFAHYKLLFLQKKLEKDTTLTADRLVVLAGYEMPEDYFEKTYCIEPHRVIKYGYVGYDKVQMNKKWSKGRNRLVYVGTFYPPHVTPVPLLKGLQYYYEKQNAKSDISMEFYGSWGSAWGSLVNRIGLHEHVVVHGFKSHDIVLDALRDSIGALVVVPDLSHELRWVPSKVSEYIGLGVPILAVCPKDSLLNELIETYDLGVSVSEENVSSGIETLVNRVENGSFLHHKTEYPAGFDRIENERRLADEIIKLSYS